MANEIPNRFERHPGITLVAVHLLALLLLLTGLEFTLRRTAGLGRPVLYERSPACVYRPQANQKIRRFHGAALRINNLGLRARGDWDAEPSNKVLFLGDSVTYGGNHLADEQLFSQISMQGLDGYLSGNAAVLGWGVENVHGLIVGERFLPAATYVSTFIEDDFYRGLARAEVRPDVWYESPRYALREVGFLLWCRLLKGLGLFENVYPGVNASGETSSEEFAQRAAAKLEELNDFLSARGFRHLLYISPSREQLTGAEEPDPWVGLLLAEHGLRAVYLRDRLAALEAGEAEILSWFQDDVHLTPAGHAVWGRLIREDLRQALPRLTARSPGT